MTPTPEQLAAVLPRCTAGIDPGDWTDDDDRLAWATKVLEFVAEAERREADDVRTSIDWLRSLRPPDPDQRIQTPTWTMYAEMMREAK